MSPHCPLEGRLRRVLQAQGTLGLLPVGTKHPPGVQTHWSSYRPDKASAPALEAEDLKEKLVTFISQRDTYRGFQDDRKGLSKGRRWRERKETVDKMKRSRGGDRRGRRHRVIQGHCAQQGSP